MPPFPTRQFLEKELARKYLANSSTMKVPFCMQWSILCCEHSLEKKKLENVRPSQQ